VKKRTEIWGKRRFGERKMGERKMGRREGDH
jgi:hypothetical protein